MIQTLACASDGSRAALSVVSTGTWVVSFAVGGDLEGLDPKRDTLANVDAYGRAVPSARYMGGREFDMMTANLMPRANKSMNAFWIRFWFTASWLYLLLSRVAGHIRILRYAG